MAKLQKVLLHILSFNQARQLEICLNAVEQLSLDGISELQIMISDNASQDESLDVANRFAKGKSNVVVKQNASNLGFAAGHNVAVSKLIQGYDFLLVLNPDVRLDRQALSFMLERASSQAEIGIVGPVLYRANSQLEPVEPALFDSRGICMTSALRHFDIDSNVAVTDLANSAEVFGISGACLLIKKECALDLLLPRSVSEEENLFQVYPQLREGYKQRAQLFDESFFAYREDADLAWRAQTLNWKAWIESRAFAFHERRVLPERRGQLDPKINAMGVRNRFILQLNNFRFFDKPSGMLFKVYLLGILIRNLFVVLGVVLVERTSLLAFKELWILRKRILLNRKYIQQKRKRKQLEVFRWFDVC